MQETRPAASDPREIAQRFVTARLRAAALADYPGALPSDLDQAYAIQDAAIALWPDTVGGWKVGRIPSPWRERHGEERLVGPIFSTAIRRSISGGVLECPVFEGGFAAVEAEYVFELGEDAPPDKLSWTPDEGRAIAAALHVGVEPASSPLESINRLGPAVVVSDFGNNAGLIVGPEVPRFWERSDESLACEAFIDGQSVGRGGGASIPGGPLAALALRCRAAPAAIVPYVPETSSPPGPPAESTTFASARARGCRSATTARYCVAPFGPCREGKRPQPSRPIARRPRTY